MFSSILSFSIIVTTVVIVVHAGRSTSQACNVYVSSMKQCRVMLSVTSLCTSAIFRFPGTDFTKSCNSTDIYWNYPVNNLTLVIDTPYTAKRQRYALKLDARQLKPLISRVFRVRAKGLTTELPFRSNTITVRSDSKFRVGLKFEGPKISSAFGVFIRYKVVRI